MLAAASPLSNASPYDLGPGLALRAALRVAGVSGFETPKASTVTTRRMAPARALGRMAATSPLPPRKLLRCAPGLPTCWLTASLTDTP
jgi:hypothetical protein